MGEFIRSAFGYFGNSGSTNKENELVGQVIEVGKNNYRIKRVIAEGGYAVVFEGIDTTKGKSVAIKRLLAHDQETSKNILNEIGVLKKLNGDPNIIGFLSAASVGKEKSKHVGTEFLIVTEFCSGGSLPDYLPTPHHQPPLAPDVVLQVLYQASRAVQHMHKQSPPIIHRDLKVENLLLSDIYTIKLCDFGSASIQTYSPNISWSAAERGKVQEDVSIKVK
ncbi:unnamed protein product [Dibothriocephalus latus]|uniref:Protein kinase domain-containing protein n=1 Tax=Dibothriocephalus latus TaxID=60516 RepID=A0A3P7N213_DIBLA|nr:unnamed protein product [Dibothriocephalus latus]